MAVQVLVAVDGSDLSSSIVPALIRLHSLAGRCSVEVLHVVDNTRRWTYSTKPNAFADELERAWAYVRGQAAAFSMVPGIEATATLVLGAFERSIADRLAHGGFEFVIVAAQARSHDGLAIRHTVAKHANPPRRAPLLVIDPITESPAGQMLNLREHRGAAANVEPALLSA
jgi:hypothetical protein